MFKSIINFLIEELYLKRKEIISLQEEVIQLKTELEESKRLKFNISLDRVGWVDVIKPLESEEVYTKKPNLKYVCPICGKENCGKTHITC